MAPVPQEDSAQPGGAHTSWGTGAHCPGQVKTLLTLEERPPAARALCWPTGASAPNTVTSRTGLPTAAPRSPPEEQLSPDLQRLPVCKATPCPVATLLLQRAPPALFPEGTELQTRQPRHTRLWLPLCVSPLGGRPLHAGPRRTAPQGSLPSVSLSDTGTEAGPTGRPRSILGRNKPPFSQSRLTMTPSCAVFNPCPHFLSQQLPQGGAVPPPLTLNPLTLSPSCHLRQESYSANLKLILRTIWNEEFQKWWCPDSWTV